eukprot:s1531_g3.t1
MSDHTKKASPADGGLDGAFVCFCTLLCVLGLLELSVWLKGCAQQPPQPQCIACVMMQRLVTCALLGFCLYLKGCGNSGEPQKCPCNRRLESVLPKADETPGRMLSSRRRRTIGTNTEYSEVCCDDWDPGSTWTVEPYDPLDYYSNSDSTTEWNWNELFGRTTAESTTETTTTPGSTTTVGWKQPQGPVYTLQNATWSSVSFLAETFDAQSCEGDWTRDNAWIALNLCVTLTSPSQRSQMFTLTDSVLLFAEWNGLECLGTPNVIEQFSTECSPGTSKAFTMLGPTMAEGSYTPLQNGPTRTGYLTYSRTPVNMPAWAYGIYSTSTCSEPPYNVWVSPLGACKKEHYGAYKMFCENGVVVQHYFEGNKDGCNGEDKCGCDPTIPPPSVVSSTGFDSLSTSACVAYDGRSARLTSWVSSNKKCGWKLEVSLKLVPKPEQLELLAQKVQHEVSCSLSAQ